MEITLEQIELVKDRTGVGYKEAKEALEYANGNVVDAIIYIEENIDRDFEGCNSSAVDNVVSAVKKAVRTGNVTKIRVFKGDDLILNIPVTVGTLAVIVFPWGVVAAAVASAAAKCRVELVKEDGSVVDINAKASGAVNTVKEKSGVVFDEIKTKGSDVYGTVKEKGGEVFESAKAAGTVIFEEAKEKGAGLYESTKGKISEFIAKGKEEEVIDITDIDYEAEADLDGSVDAGDDSSDCE